MSTVTQLRIVTGGKVEPVWQEFHACLSEDPGVCIIEVTGGGLDLLLAVKHEQPAAVILNGATEASGISSHLFSEYPDVTILKLCGTGKAFIEQRCPNEQQVILTDPVTLSKTLRLAVEDPCSNGRPT